MLKKLSFLGILALGFVVSAGCSEGRRGVSFHGPYHDVNFAYDVDKDDYGSKKVHVVKFIESHD